ncbi:MAG TPA: aldehyde dehydrogenase family protein [Steroidobacteraceae bacterium]|nr:aldehyde dehydrogenase family protein [Steroidobacteraceae bacterium]
MAEQSSAGQRRCFNPADGRSRDTRPYLTRVEVQQALTRAAAARLPWAQASLSDRAGVLRRAASLLRAERATLAATITAEMGKTIAEAEAEIDKSAWNCEYVAAQASQWLADEVVPTQASSSYVAHRPLGAVLAILPWNFPIWQIFRCAVSNLVAGNTFLLKHAPNVPDCAAQVTHLLSRAGAPSGAFENVDVPVDMVAELIADPRVAAVAFTGSPKAGAAVAALAGAACKKSILELGGSDAFIVLEDADLEGAVAAAVRGRFANCGQVCLAAKRFIVVEALRTQFEERFAAAIAQLRMGDPLDRTTALGPMARADLRETLDQQIKASVRQGARIVCGGRIADGPGYYYPATLLTQATGAMPVVSEETFGPVAPVMAARDAEQALQIANDSRYGLAAVLWTADTARARKLAVRLEAGSVFVNGVTASDPRLPVGGVKLSGYGRELGSTGIRELLNLQSVWIGP